MSLSFRSTVIAPVLVGIKSWVLGSDVRVAVAVVVIGGRRIVIPLPRFLTPEILVDDDLIYQDHADQLVALQQSWNLQSRQLYILGTNHIRDMDCPFCHRDLSILDAPKTCSNNARLTSESIPLQYLVTSTP